MNILGITAFSSHYVNHKYISEIMKIGEMSNNSYNENNSMYQNMNTVKIVNKRGKKRFL